MRSSGMTSAVCPPERRHAAGLNFCDCFSYALAKATGQPLLFKGDDFSDRTRRVSDSQAGIVEVIP
jgi:hypothetical protein